MKYSVFFCLTLGAFVMPAGNSNAMASAPAPAPESNTHEAFFTPEPYVWAMQEVLGENWLKPSTAWREMVSQGTEAPLLTPWEALNPRSGWQRAVVQVTQAPNAPAFLEASFTAGSAGLELPALPAGEYWVKLRFYGDGWASGRLFFLNIAESATAHTLPTATLAEPLLRIERDGKGSDIRVRRGNAEQEGVLRVAVAQMNTRPLSQTQKTLAAGQSEETISIAEALPGKTLRVNVELLEGGRVVDQDMLWLDVPGDTPLAASWDAGATPPVTFLFDSAAGETVSTQGSFADQKEGLAMQIASMAERGSDTIQLWIDWGRIEMISGARDWSNIDAYVNFLTENKVPFVLAGAGKVLFGNAPTDLWGEWSMNHKSNYILWRGMPIISPAAATYHPAAADFTRRMIERYKDNPYLLGYGFLNQGLDSGIYQEHYDSILDYSASAREDFRNFLQARYDSLPALNLAWGTAWNTWQDVTPPLPLLEQEVNLSPAWKDWTDWKIKTYRSVSVDLFDPVIAELDPERVVIHYNAKTGPFEHSYPGLQVKHWGTADGAGEDYRMGRINGITQNWNLYRQTESHNVPPNNRRYMMDMWGESLRSGGEGIRYNLVFNSQPALFKTRYPQDEQLKSVMQWWGQTAPLRASLLDARPASLATGVVLSWDDMLYRGRVWRWYAMPGNRADAMVRQENLLPVSWVSGLTPEKAWDELEVLLVPEDAMVWGTELEGKLKAFVARGGKLVLWGRAGQYLVDHAGAEGSAFPWLADFGAAGMQATAVPEEQAGAVSSVQYGELRGMLAPAVAVEHIPENVSVVRDGRGRPQILSWPFGKGQITWCLSDSKGESERFVSALLVKDGAPQEVLSSSPLVDAFFVYLDGERYLILNRYLGFNAKAEDVPVATRIRVPGLAEGQWSVVRVDAPEAQEPQAYTADALGQSGWEVQLLPSETQVFRVTQQAL